MGKRKLNPACFRKKKGVVVAENGDSEGDRLALEDSVTSAEVSAKADSWQKSGSSRSSQ